MTTLQKSQQIERHRPEIKRNQWVRRRGVILLGGLTMLLFAVVTFSVTVGAVAIAPNQVAAILLNEMGIDTGIEFEQRQRSVLMVIRLPRVVLGVLIGAAMASAGAAIQGMFRNPLADPGLIGISGGAAFAAATMIVLGNTILSGVTAVIGPFALPLAAFVGGVMTTVIIYRLATVGGRTNIATMLLAGIAINALAGAGIGILVSVASTEQVRDITFWNLGSLATANWEMIRTVAPFVVITLLPLPLLARPLNALLLGETEAQHLGFNVERIKQAVVLLVALAVGASVAVAGTIGFVGLVVPHLLRLMAGPDHRYVLPGSALLGASLLVAADVLARTVAAPAEVSIGIVTALIGAPFFLWLLLRDRNRGSML